MSRIEILNLVMTCLLILQSVALFVSARIINDNDKTIDILDKLNDCKDITIDKLIKIINELSE